MPFRSITFSFHQKEKYTVIFGQKIGHFGHSSKRGVSTAEYFPFVLVNKVLVKTSNMMCGGTSDAKEMTPEVIEVCHQIRPALEEKLGSACATFEPKSFKSQVSNIQSIGQN